MIGFLSSSGAIKVTARLADQDIRIGIPNLLLCLEMAIFSILHFFAFPWQPYRLKTQQASEDPQYINGQIAYHGGFLGIKALLECFNPWDLVKAVGRGFRWLFVGYKKRTMDSSYMHHADSSFSLKASKVGEPETSVPGPNVTAYGGSAALDTAYHPADRYETASDEGQQLLSHAQGNPTSLYPGPRGTAYSNASDDETGYGQQQQQHNNNRFYGGHVYDHDAQVMPDLTVAEPRPISPQPYRPYQPPRSPYEGA